MFPNRILVQCVCTVVALVTPWKLTPSISCSACWHASTQGHITYYITIKILFIVKHVRVHFERAITDRVLQVCFILKLQSVVQRNKNCQQCDSNKDRSYYLSEGLCVCVCVRVFVRE